MTFKLHPVDFSIPLKKQLCCSKQESFWVLLPLFCHVAHDGGNCHLSIQVIKGQCACDTPFRTFSIDVFKFGDSNFTTLTRWLQWICKFNRSISQMPQCTSLISHNASLYKVVHCSICLMYCGICEVDLLKAIMLLWHQCFVKSCLNCASDWHRRYSDTWTNHLISCLNPLSGVRIRNRAPKANNTTASLFRTTLFLFSCWGYVQWPNINADKNYWWFFSQYVIKHITICDHFKLQWRHSLL